MDMFKPGFKIGMAVVMVLAVQLLSAQSLRVKATINKDQINVGEPILLELEAESSGASAVGWFKMDSIPGFEFLDAGKIDTLEGSLGKIYRQTFTITSYDSGSHQIPQMAASISNDRYLTDSLKVEVGYSSPRSDQAYHDVKDILEVQVAEPVYINYIIVVLTVLAIIALVFLLRFKARKAVKASPAVSGLQAYEKAMKSLKDLKEERLPEKGENKVYYSRLNEILRNYCREEGLGIRPDSNNADIVLQVKPLLQNEEAMKLAQELRLTDAVKFAKYNPVADEPGTTYSVISSVIEHIHQQVPKKISN